jgi:hypothetical protein
MSTLAALDLALTRWHESEMEVSRLRDAMTQVLRLQTGVSQQAKTIIRAALAATVSSKLHGEGK